jgi:uncharacterized protein YecT (DUF1311 family)
MRLKIIATAIAVTVCCVIVSVSYAQKKQNNKKQPKAPCRTAQTQFELNQCACDEYKKADADLNKVYQQLLSVNAREQEFTEKLKTAQRAWIVFRDAQLESLYPAIKDPRAQYGSVYPMCYCLAQKELTLQRTDQLKRMLNPKEGDPCG